MTHIAPRDCRTLLLPCLLALVAGACTDTDAPLATGPAPTQVSPISPLASVSTYTGIPYGATGIMRNDGTPLWGPDAFTSASTYTDAASLVARLNAARAAEMKLILNMTGGSHERYKTDGKFDYAKWKAVMDTYDKPAIKDAVREAVADGTIIMNSVMDEPQITSWGGVMTKPLLDEMAAYVKAMFPTLPVGVVARWDWRPEERYQVIDAILAQYQWNKGDIAKYRDDVLARARVEGVEVIFSLNILDGGIMSWQTKECPIPLTGGHGTKVPNCKMTPDQIRDWGRLLGVAGCAMNMWRYDAPFFNLETNKQAFRDVAATLAGLPGRPCRRTGQTNPPPPPPPANDPPVAAFTPPGCVAGRACEFTDASSDGDGSIASRQWDFGNGETASGASPSVTFAEPGEYTVRLEVSDDDGATDAVTHPVTVSAPGNEAPTAAFTAPDCTAGAPCQFTDASSDPDGTINDWTWDFGDGGTASAENPSHTFDAAGDYTVRLAVTDDAGASDAVTRTVSVRAPNGAPTAAFTAPSCTAGVPCSFSDGSTDADGTIASRRWDFGNGSTATGATPSVTYAAAGSYDVQLEVTDDDGATDAVTKSVTVAPAPRTPPNADFTVSCTGLTCSFTDRSTDPDARITGRSWTFGDGGSSTALSPTRTYAAGGTYTVTLTLTYDGGTDQHSAQVTVTAPAPRITLTVATRRDPTNYYADLRWSGATGSQVTVFRNGNRLTNTANDGRWTNTIRRPGNPSYTYRVCQLNSTVCSPTVTARFR